jgi:hypothetical protein
MGASFSLTISAKPSWLRSAVSQKSGTPPGASLVTPSFVSHSCAPETRPARVAYSGAYSVRYLASSARCSACGQSQLGGLKVGGRGTHQEGVVQLVVLLLHSLQRRDAVLHLAAGGREREGFKRQRGVRAFSGRFSR